MKHVKAVALISLLCVLVAPLAMMSFSDESDAIPYKQYNHTASDVAVNVATIGVQVNFGEDPEFDITIHSKPTWLTVNGGDIVGTPTSKGEFFLDYSFTDTTGNYADRIKIKIIVIGTDEVLLKFYDLSDHSRMDYRCYYQSVKKNSQFEIPAVKKTSSGSYCTKWKFINPNPGESFVKVSAGTSLLPSSMVKSNQNSVLITSDEPFNQPVKRSVYFNGSGGSTPPVSLCIPGHSITLPSSEKSGYVLTGWYTAANGGTRAGGAGDQYTPETDITLYAQWTTAVVSITSTPSDLEKVVGQGWTYTVACTPPDATISVSGASWLSVSGKVITGTVGPAGDYNIVVTASKAGYATKTQTFVIHVSNELVFTSNASAGFIVQG